MWSVLNRNLRRGRSERIPYDSWPRRGDWTFCDRRPHLYESPIPAIRLTLGHHKQRRRFRVGLGTQQPHLASRLHPAGRIPARRKRKLLGRPLHAAQADTNGRGTCGFPLRLTPSVRVGGRYSVVPQHLEIRIGESDVPSDDAIRELLPLVANPKSGLCQRRNDRSLRALRWCVEVDMIQFDC